MKEERRVFVLIGVVVLAFIFLLPTIVLLLHPYTYVGGKNKNEEQVEETPNQQQNNDKHNQENDKKQDDITKIIFETTVETTPNLKDSIKKVSNQNGSVRCFVSSSSDIYDSEIGHILYYEDFKIKKVSYESKTIFHTNDLIDEARKNAKDEMEIWKNIEGINVTSTYDENTKTAQTIALMDLSIGTNFEASNGSKFSSKVKYDANINKALDSKIFSNTFCMELE